jgi:PAS domain S-box-containing protein
MSGSLEHRRLRCRQFAHVLGLTVVAASATVLVGWLLNISSLKSVLPGLSTMKPLTAVNLGLAGVALWSATTSLQADGISGNALFASFCSVLVGLIGSLTIVEYVAQLDLRFDNLLFPGALAATAEAYPGRMSYATAVGFLVISVALLCLVLQRPRQWPLDNFLALIVILIGGLALEGYLFGVEALYRVYHYSSMALHTAAMLVILGIGVLLARPDTGIAGILISQESGGLIARRFLPVVILLPFLVGWLRWRGEVAGWYDSPFGTALFIAANIIGMGSIVFISARQLNMLDWERQRARKDQQENAIRLAGIVDSAMDAIVSVDQEQRITLVNPGAKRMFGYSERDLLGQPLGRLISEGPSSGSETVRRAGETKIIDRSLGQLGLLHGLGADGTEFPIEASMSQSETDGRKIFTLIMRDVTERKRTEEVLHESNLTLQAFIQASPLAIVALDMERKVKLWNPAAERLFGWTESEVIGKLLPTIPEEDLPNQLKLRDRFLSGGTTISDLESRRLCKDGSIIEVSASFAPLVDSHGAIIGSIGIIADITERKQAEQELKSSHQRLEQTLAELQRKSDEVSRMTQQLWQTSKLATMGELAAGIAHELNNPLSTLALRAESLLQQLSDDDPKRRAIEVIGQEVERMGRLVGNLLQFSRRSYQQISTVDVRDEIENSLELVEYHLRSHKVEIVREFGTGLPTIQADRQQLHQVFVNLITNASDAMPQGGKLIVRCVRGRLNDSVDCVKIEFVDSGAGISQTDMQQIWEPFFTTKPEGKGTGLGLAICRRIVEEHHGTISIKSRLGEGTTVLILLPASNGNAEMITAGESPNRH